MEHLFLQYVEEYLKENFLWMCTDDRKKAAHFAEHLYNDMDYSSFEAAAEAAVKSIGGATCDFEMKISYRSGKLMIDYCDGADTETYNIEPCIDEICDTLQDAIESVLSSQDTEEDKA